MTLTYPSKALPVLRECDVCIAGGSLAGITAALALAQAGRRVLLLEPRTYLGREITAMLRPWLNPGGRHPFSPFVAALVQAAGEPSVNHPEIALHLDRLKTHLEDQLLAAGVDLLYASYAVQVLADAQRISGLVIANKSGRQVIRCAELLDATETALLARLAGAAFAPPPEHAIRCHRTLEYVTRPSPQRELRVPPALGLAGDRICTHGGPRNDRHLFVEFALDFAPGPHDYPSAVQRELEARRRSLELAFYLNQNEPAFFDSYLASSAHELHGPKTTRMTGPTPAWASADAGLLRLPVNGQPELMLPAQDLAGPLPGLWCLNDAARLPTPAAAAFQDPLAAAWLGAGLGTHLGTHLGAAPAPTTAHNPSAPIDLTTGTAHSEQMVLREPDAPQHGRPYPRQQVPPGPLASGGHYAVLVAGGGTSGAAAAIASGREGARTLLLEMNPGLGGTGTLGGVPEYWMGNRTGFMREIEQAVQALDQRLGFVPPDRWHHWSLEGKLNALLSAAVAAGVQVSFFALCTGALVNGEQVQGVAAATPYGPLAFFGQVVIDATGDGDIAAFAGADFVYGAERDHSTLWYSLPQISAPGMAMGGNFTSMVDISNVEDVTRAILAGRRRRTGIHDHGIYLAPRESRHILADVVLTFTDMLLQRRWPDVVNLFYSNYDVKGKSSSDWNLAGLISANLEVEFPYRALLPRRIEGLLVAGKAFSASSDATPLIRMQSDLENLGWVSGLAAAMAAQAGCQPRHIDIPALQRRLTAAGLLPERILTRALQPRRLGLAEIKQWIERIDASQPLYAINNRPEHERFRERIPIVEVCTAGPAAIPLLGQALEESEGPRQTLLAQALALCGDPTGAPLLAETILTMLGPQGLPARSAFILNVVQHLPDHAAMPDVVYLLYSLGMARHPIALPVWQRVAQRLNFSDEDFRDAYQSPYYYVDAVCYGAERLGDPRALPILEQIHRHPLLHDQLAQQGFQADYMLERLAGLELMLARAMARCGSPRGIEILIGYLQDVRSPLVEHAHRELTRITGQAIGKDPAAWNSWLAHNRAALRPQPWLGASDAQRAWQQEIFTE